MFALRLGLACVAQLLWVGLDGAYYMALSPILTASSFPDRIQIVLTQPSGIAAWSNGCAGWRLLQHLTVTLPFRSLAV